MPTNDQQGHLSDKFRDFGAPPSEGLWNAITETLDQKQKRRTLFWWWSAVFALLLSTATGITVYWLSGKNNSAPTNAGVPAFSSAQGKAPTSAPAPRGSASRTPFMINRSTTTKEVNPSPATSFAPRSFAGAGHRAPFTDAPAVVDAASVPATMIALAPATLPVTSETPAKTELSVAPAITDSTTAESDSATILAESPVTAPDVVPEPVAFLSAPARPKWSFGINAGYYWAGRDPNKNTEKTIPPPNATSGGTSDQFSNLTYSGIPSNTISGNAWTFNVTAARTFGHYLFVQSGFSAGRYNVSRIAQTTLTATGISYQLGEQSRWSFGVPVYVGANLFTQGRFSLKTALGWNSDLFFAKYNDKQLRGYRGSLEYSLGLQYRVVSNLYVEVAPQVRYYLVDQGSGAPGRKKDAWPGVSMGVVWKR